MDIPPPAKRKLWLFDPDRLKPGDVLLESGESFYSPIIKLVEWGKYSHALLWLGDTSFLEAVGIGARVLSVKRLIVDDPRKWAVLRLVKDADSAKRAADEARNLAHLPYDLKGAIFTKLPLRKSEAATAMFCSQLVAEAYSRAGVELVKGRKPSAVTPKMLHTCSKLEVVEPYLVEIGEFDVSNIDRDASYPESLTYTDLVVSQRALACAVATLPKGTSQPGNLVQLYELLGAMSRTNADPVSAALVAAFDGEGYFELVEGHGEEIKALLIGVQASVHDQQPSERAVAACEMKALSEAFASTSKRHSKLAEKYSCAEHNTGLPIWRRLSDMHTRNAELFTDLERLATEVAEAASRGL